MSTKNSTDVKNEGNSSKIAIFSKFACKMVNSLKCNFHPDCLIVDPYFTRPSGLFCIVLLAEKSMQRKEQSDARREILPTKFHFTHFL